MPMYSAPTRRIAQRPPRVRPERVNGAIAAPRLSIENNGYDGA